MRGYLYLLQNDKGGRYVGSTNDLNRRIKEHKRKHNNSRYTKIGTWRLIYFEEYNNIREARLIERKIKRSRTERLKFYKRSKSGISSVG